MKIKKKNFQCMYCFLGFAKYDLFADSFKCSRCGKESEVLEYNERL